MSIQTSKKLHSQHYNTFYNQDSITQKSLEHLEEKIDHRLKGWEDKLDHLHQKIQHIAQKINL